MGRGLLLLLSPLAVVAVLCALAPVAALPAATKPRRAAGTTCSGFACLQEYVSKDDGMFAWVDTGARLTGHNEAVLPWKHVNWTGYCVNVTSQQWLTPNETSRSVWWHAVVVVVPSNLKRLDTASLFITKGKNDNPDSAFPKQGKFDIDLELGAELAMHTGLVTAVLYQVPNQHITFPSDPKQQSREEDAIIAYTWRKFIEDPVKYREWPLRLPMTKAGVKAMDAVAQFAATLDNLPSGGKLALTKFLVAGESKRGWTTWTVGAVDSRVVGIVPIVMDELNFVKNIHHHYRAYGGWSFALSDYYAENITAQMDNPNTQELMDIVDPYSFKERYTMPKLVVNAGNDEFFLPDDTRYWLTDLPGPMHFLLAPNAEHSEVTAMAELVPAIATFVDAVASGAQVPQFTYEISEDGTDIVVHTGADGNIPTRVTKWYAHTCDSKRRDFRVLNAYDECSACGVPFNQSGATCANLKIFWSSEELEEDPRGSGTYTAHQDPLDDGRWTAFFVDVVYTSDLARRDPTRHVPAQTNASSIARPLSSSGGGGVRQWPALAFGDFDFTSMVSIVPQTFPFPDCHNEGCVGELV